LSDSPFAPDFAPIDTKREVPFLGDLESAISDIRGRKTATTPEELAGLEGLFKTADPTLRLQKAQEFINQIVGPRNEAQAIAAGFGRGPAALEATTRAGAELALPIVTESGRQQAIANQFKIALSQAAQARGTSRDRAVFEAVAAKVAQGQTTRGLNLQATGLQSEQEISRANIGLSTQDRTLALLNQLRQIQASQAQIRARPIQRFGSTTGAQRDTLSRLGPSRSERARSSLLEAQAEVTRRAPGRAESAALDARLAANPLSGFGGGLSSGFSSSPSRTRSPGVVLSGGGATPSTPRRSVLTGASTLFA